MMHRHLPQSRAKVPGHITRTSDVSRAINLVTLHFFVHSKTQRAKARAKAQADSLQARVLGARARARAKEAKDMEAREKDMEARELTTSSGKVTMNGKIGNGWECCGLLDIKWEKARQHNNTTGTHLLRENLPTILSYTPLGR